MASNTITVKVDPKIARALSNLSDVSGVSKTRIVNDALVSHLGITGDDAAVKLKFAIDSARNLKEMTMGLADFVRSAGFASLQTAAHNKIKSLTHE